MKKSISKGTLVKLMGNGLLQFVLNKVDREIFKDTADLLK